ncbi:hypothetical protein TNCV_1316361 [Trichonephila clavipes]|nr:hypothetical protein TNCV_1316361 [Trichonephila clavipes]
MPRLEFAAPDRGPDCPTLEPPLIKIPCKVRFWKSQECFDIHLLTANPQAVTPTCLGGPPVNRNRLDVHPGYKGLQLSISQTLAPVEFYTPSQCGGLGGVRYATGKGPG